MRLFVVAGSPPQDPTIRKRRVIGDEEEEE
jgi:hypothetical protein